MRNVLLFCFTLIVLSFPVLAQETITLTTYYPAPFGVYQRLVTNTLGVGDTNVSGTVDANDGPNPAVAGQEGDVWVAGNVGIGTTNPQAMLHVNGGFISERSDAADTANIIVRNSVDNDGAIVNDQGSLVLGGTGANGYMAFYTGGPTTEYERMRIDKSGDIGIGTTTPEATLDVSGGIKVGSDTTCNAQKRGTLRYSGNKIQFCSPTGWQDVGGGGGGGFSVGDCSWGGCGPGFANPPYHGYGACELPNELTGSCSCPAGFTRQLISEVGEPYPPYWDGIYICR